MHGTRVQHGTRFQHRTASLSAALAALLLAQGCAPQTRQAGAPANASAGPAPGMARAGSPSVSDTGYVVAATDSAAGAYLALVGGCNDCHTVGWAESSGATPHAERLMGSSVGYRGPWGTSYAANLRLVTSRTAEDRWVEILTTADGGHGRPPMPWMNTAQMSQRDLRNLYRYIRALGPRGDRAPRAVPPDSAPTTPFILMVPQQPGSGGR